MKNFLKFSLLAGILMMVSGVARAQQEAMYSQYMFNGLILNPAYAGSNEGLSAAALYRNQWVGVEGAPVTQTLSVHAPLERRNIGLGLSVVNDKIGVSNTLSMNGIYAFRIRTNAGVWSLGQQAGITRFGADYTQVALNPQGRPDEQFSLGETYLMFNFGVGTYYYTDKFYAGISSPNFFRTRITGEGNKEALPKHAPHYFLSTGYVFTLSDIVKLKPAAIVKITKGAPVLFDFNTNVWLHDRIGLGASYRHGNALVGMVELQMTRQLRLGYAYDHPTSDLNRYRANTHELMLRFDVFSDGQRYVSPRLF